jgi:hypothetical protein
MHWCLNDSTRHDLVGSIKRTTEAMHRGQEAGSAEPPGAAAPPSPAAPVQLVHTSHMASVIQGNTAVSNPGRRSEVGSIQMARLASLGSMDPQASDQPTLANNQHSTYTKEHAPECMTRGPRPAAPRDPATPPSRSELTHNRLLTASGTKSQMLNQRQ